MKNSPSAIKYKKGPKPKFIEIVLFEKAPNKSEIKYKLAERITKFPILSNNRNDSDSKIIWHRVAESFNSISANMIIPPTLNMIEFKSGEKMASKTPKSHEVQYATPKINLFIPFSSGGQIH